MSTLKKYNRKKSQTLNNRNVGFELTFEEYKTIYNKATTCDYTDEPFDERDSDYHISLERIDKKLPYRKDNCCLVIQKANLLKDVIEDGDEGGLKLRDKELIDKIKTTLESKTRLQLAGKYFPELLIEKVIEGEVIMVEDNKHTDLQVAQEYVKLSSKEESFEVSFNVFKKKYLRKTCEVSGKVFDETNHYTSKCIAKVDVDKPFSDDNICVVCVVFNTMMNNKLFTQKELSMASKNI